MKSRTNVFTAPSFRLKGKFAGSMQRGTFVDLLFNEGPCINLVSLLTLRHSLFSSNMQNVDICLIEMSGLRRNRRNNELPR